MGFWGLGVRFGVLGFGDEGLGLWFRVDGLRMMVQVLRFSFGGVCGFRCGSTEPVF